MDLSATLLGCFGDTKSAVMGAFCPCYLLAKNKAELDERDCNICDCLCLPNQYQIRQQIRAKYGLDYSPTSDFLQSLLCPSCATCQDTREISFRKSTYAVVSDPSLPAEEAGYGHM